MSMMPRFLSVMVFWSGILEMCLSLSHLCVWGSNSVASRETVATDCVRLSSCWITVDLCVLQPKNLQFWVCALEGK